MPSDAPSYFGFVWIPNMPSQLHPSIPRRLPNSRTLDRPTRLAFLESLKSCSALQDLRKGIALHADLLNMGFLQTNPCLANALIHMYAKCAALGKARQLHDELTFRNVVTWNALISGYAQQAQGYDAVCCYERMQGEGISPNAVTFTCILNACGSIGAIEKGVQIHSYIMATEFWGKDLMLGNALIGMYSNCSVLSKATRVHEELPVRNVVSWNSLMSGYVQHGRGHEAIYCFERMQGEGFSPDAVTSICILKACSCIDDVETGRVVHDWIVIRGFLEKDIKVGNCLVDMYVKSGALREAQQVLENLPARNEVSWSALIAGYVGQDLGAEALKCYEKMQNEGLSPDAVTFSYVLKACGSTGAINKGIQIHKEIVNRGLLKNNFVLGSALVGMYAKCGAFEKAQEMLEELPVRNVVSWSALIAGYAEHGHGSEALKCFEQMQTEGLCPDAVSFRCLLHACSHSGLFDTAQTYFANMSKKYGITPNLHHLMSMVLVLVNAGDFDKAMSLMQAMPSSGEPPIWCALLCACRRWGNMQLGKLAFDVMA